MPVQEALQFWKHQYSMAPHGDPRSGCGPKWVGKERRYTYSIRHLYGLEGSQVNYRAHCCASLQVCIDRFQMEQFVWKVELLVILVQNDRELYY